MRADLTIKMAIFCTLILELSKRSDLKYNLIASQLVILYRARNKVFTIKRHASTYVPQWDRGLVRRQSHVAAVLYQWSYDVVGR